MAAFMAAVSAEGLDTVSRQKPPTPEEERAFIATATAAGAVILIAVEGPAIVGLLDVWPGVCRLELEVVPWNLPAIGLYRSLDFVVEGTKSKAINLRGQPEDLIMMALTW